ncbi:MAG: sodium ion-translocating decarboxylase subunit beta [Polyangia bacterium]|jgi:oxaloacetate decarboxylase beta subunit|nr:sodium ion-translocating decarboxylase subunit beta [Polyangia bacterium]
MDLLNRVTDVISQTGVVNLTWEQPVMWLVALVFVYLGIRRNVEPLLLVPIGFSAFLVNLPLAPLTPDDLGQVIDKLVGQHSEPGLFQIFFHYGFEKGEIIPSLIFLGLGALTDFGPLLSNPKSLLLGAAAQVGVYMAMFGALLLGFSPREAASIGIIGGADGPTTIYVTVQLAPHILAATALSAYSYMALVPIVQPPVVRLLTTEEERARVMKQSRKVSKTERIIFPVACTLVVCLLVPQAAPLIGMLMLGNLFRECGVVERLNDAAQNSLMNIVTIFLGIGVGSTMEGSRFLRLEVLGVYALGLAAFVFATAGGVLFAKFFNLFLKEKFNPVIGAAGVSAVPMAARVAHQIGQQANKRNYLLMHAMGPNVAGVIGTIVAAGIFIALLKP